MIRISDIIDTVLEYNPNAETGLVERAYIYSARVHEGQVRLSGEPYLSHPLEVAGILASMKMDSVCVSAGLLHDVLEDTSATEAEINELFGDEVLHIVSGLTKLSTLPYNSAQARQADSIRKMILAMADDIRVILIKLVDRLHNMRTLQYQKEHKKQRIARETLDIYAPIALRLGIYWIKNELEDIAFQVLDPEKYSDISSRIRKDEVEREEYIDTVRDYILEKLTDNGLEGAVSGRHKHFYSIYQKMLKQGLPFDEVYDIIAFRIILDTVPQCYEALGIIHSLWKPIPKKFKDYIAVPKPNMYQSLHTTVFGPFGERVEIQIRTKEMDRVAKSGIAAHWSYKEGKVFPGKEGKAYAWIQKLVETQEDYKAPGEFLENVRLDLFSDEVHVFTPAGEIRSMIRGATPVDFAYMIHTEVGHQCVGAKVNGKMTPLSRVLNTGDIVEIVTSSKSKPSKDWLNFVQTAKAKSRIRQWIKGEERDRSLQLGKEMCEKIFRKYRLNFSEVVKSDEMAEVAGKLGFKTVDDLLEHVGYGKITPRQVVQKLLPHEKNQSGDGASLFDRLMGRVKKRKPTGGVIVHGLDDVLVKFAKCCQPVPGDKITGYITRGSGVAVHRATCVNVLKVSPERQIDVEWDQSTASRYPVKISIRSYDRVGLLAEVTSVISKYDANILSALTETSSDHIVEIYFTLSVDGAKQLTRIIEALQKLKSVYEVKRLSA
ncbi:MAG: bifunctional (p)ppGpp synthetase/guanosine-3',5'-bis(diphosphate) 3'-pyrophosphohydrolase [Thermodesulfobacteriota bacterium]|nr:bifunctional (p)ppGpp synthetase/guanosine-3',5'-bis(diphosphate) 3'-pyrophosphohydrolase [Thermodesulfobacteriota bacterium]